MYFCRTDTDEARGNIYCFRISERKRERVCVYRDAKPEGIMTPFFHLHSALLFTEPNSRENPPEVCPPVSLLIYVLFRFDAKMRRYSCFTVEFARKKISHRGSDLTRRFRAVSPACDMSDSLREM